jgi:hypothetical protein
MEPKGVMQTPNINQPELLEVLTILQRRLLRGLPADSLFRRQLPEDASAFGLFRVRFDY